MSKTLHFLLVQSRFWRASARYGQKNVPFSSSCQRQIRGCGRVCQRHDGASGQIKRDQKDLTLEKLEYTQNKNENVSLIVQLLHKNRKDSDSDKVVLNQEEDKISVESLKKSLEDISWDTLANIRRCNSGQLESELEEKEEDEVDEEDEDDETGASVHDNVPEMSFIEDIYLDDDVVDARKLSRAKKKGKHVVKGTPDPSVPKSGIPCSGCGAELHCQDPIIPGYMPKEKFLRLTKKEMQTSRCQRCFLMTVHNLFLNVKVPADIYPQIMRKIKDTHALVVLVVDLFDIENSLFKNLLNHIGKKRPLFIVGNKVDLIPKDRKGYLERLKEKLLNICNSAGLNPTGKNIRHVCLVSAKTGYGIEELITKLMTQWKLQDVFVVGCTNVGKSTLFNALLMSDYCKSNARSHINRATVSVWPGTTLNLLKFPIMNPEPWRLMLRAARLAKDRAKFSEEEWMKNSDPVDMRDAVLKGHVGLTDFRSKAMIAEEKVKMEKEAACQDIVSFSLNSKGQLEEISGRKQIESFAPALPEYQPEGMKLYWACDTPGVINPEQIINFLEPEELVCVLPKFLVQPRCLVLKPGQVLFVSGMGRIDYIKGNASVYMTVHCSHQIPLHVKDGCDSDSFYQQAWGTRQLGVPQREPEKMLKIPSLVGREFEITGIGWDLAAADIQLSSLGWVSVAAGKGMAVNFRAYTPGARGLHLRSPSLVPEFIHFRGKRRKKTPFYDTRRPKE